MVDFLNPSFGWLDFPVGKERWATKPELPRPLVLWLQDDPFFFGGGFSKAYSSSGGVSFGSYNQKSANCHLDRGFRTKLVGLYPSKDGKGFSVQ